MKNSSLSLAVILAGSWTAAASAQPASRPSSSYDLPNNFYGAHLLVGGGTGRDEAHLRWARHLVGRWGYAKTLFSDIDAGTKGPRKSWVEYVQKCYQLELIPFLRLGGHMREGQWVAPAKDADGSYTGIARAVRRVVEGIPRSDLCPLYIEIWNEPNLAVEWTGKPNHQEYADFFVAVAKEIHAIGDDRIRVLNGGLATSPDWAAKLCDANPDFIKSFDVWSCHPYPMNRPPSINHHEKTAPAKAELCVDGYLLELEELRRRGRDDVKVMITETGYDLGNATYTREAGLPIINEDNRADYMVRLFRDHYPKWDNLVAVFPFEFCSPGWQRFDWVYPDSGTNEDGSPTKPHYQYTAVAALARPTDTTGAISGTITVAEVDTRLEGVRVSCGDRHFTSDAMGNYFLAALKPGTYTLKIVREGFTSFEKSVEVKVAENTVVDAKLEATLRADLGGVVRDSDGPGVLEGVRVRLIPGDHETTTDRTGRFRFKDVIPARYSLTASLDGRCEYKTDGLAIIAGKTNLHNFVLGRKACPSTENLAGNPSIEAGGGGGGKEGVALAFEPPDASVFDGALVGLSEQMAHTGQRSQVVKGSPSGTYIRQITHYGTIDAGKRYAAGMWIRTVLPKDAEAWVCADFTDNGGGVLKRIDPPEKLTGRTPGWVWVAVEGVAPEGSRRLSLGLYVKGKGGLAFFDDAFIGFAGE